MKLYYSPGVCSLSPHIVLREAELPFTLARVDLKSKKTADGEDFSDINPKGYVPVLELDSGARLTEGPAIVQYLADQVPEKRLAPPNGSLERYRLQEWLNFVSTELHKNFSPLFQPHTPEEYKPLAREKLDKRFSYVDEQLAERPFLAGKAFSVVDAYLFTVTNWAKFVNVELGNLSHLGAFMGRMRERPAVQAALRAEGLLQ
jgi:glutathione S-transferase